MRAERRLAAIMAADVVGYSRLMGQDEEGTVRQVKSLLDDVVRPAVAEHRGRIVKTMGDGFLGEFASVVEAFECALKVQKAAVKRAHGVADIDQIVLRIGINVGDIIIEDGDVFGEGVNIAARLEGICDPGGICVSGRAWEDLRKLKHAFTDMGELKLKNIAQPVRVLAYQPPARVRPAPAPAAAKPEPEPPLEPEAPTARAPDPHMRWRVATAVSAVVIVLGVIGVKQLWQARPPKARSPAASEFVSAEVGKMACSWLRVTEQAGTGVYTLSGASGAAPAAISAQLQRGAETQNLKALKVNAGAVAPLDPQRCAWIDALRPFRSANPPHFDLRVGKKARGLTRAELTFRPEELGPFGALYGIEPSGDVQRVLGRADVRKFAVRNGDGTYTLHFDTDKTGWNGVIFLQSDSAVPRKAVEQPMATEAQRETFASRAKAGGWRFELAWFWVEP